MDHIAGVVDIVGVVAGAAVHHVGAALAIEHVVAAATIERVDATATDDGVGQLVAAQGQAGGAGIGAQELDLLTGPQRVVGAGVDGVGSSADRLVDHIAGIVDIVGVVAGAAVHRVGASLAVENVVAAAAIERVDATAADDGVGELVAAQGQAGGAGIGAQELDLLTGLQRVVDAGVDRVGSFADRLVDHIAGIVDKVGVVAGAAVHHVGAGLAIEQCHCRRHR